jgi:hypothetical protein
VWSHWKRGRQAESSRSKIEAKMALLVTERVGGAWERMWVVCVVGEVER